MKEEEEEFLSLSGPELRIKLQWREIPQDYFAAGRTVAG